MNGSHRRVRWGAAIALVVVALVVVTARASVESSRSLSLGIAAESEGDAISAAYHYRHAAQWLTPFGGADDEALSRLVDLGDARNDAGDVEGALFCWRSARSAVMATRHLWTPHVDVLDGLHPRIADAMAIQRTDDPDARPAHADRYRAQLDAWRDRQPSPWHAAGASLAFVAWIGALAAAGWFGLTAEGRVRRRPLGLWLGGAAALFATWWLLVRFA